MNQEELRDEIIKEFGDKLESIDADVKIIEATEIPREEMAKNNARLDFVGKWKNRFVYIMKQGLKIIAIIVLLSEAIERGVKYIPKTIELARSVSDKLHERVERDLSENIDAGEVVIFNSEWTDNPEQYERDKYHFQTGRIPDMIMVGTTLTTSGIIDIPTDSYIVRDTSIT